MLGAGFFTTQKSQEVVHTGVTQASSSVELSGDVIADGSTGEITNLYLTLQQTSGGSVVDLGKTLIVVSAPDMAPTELKVGGTANETNFKIKTKYNDDGDGDLIGRFEKFEVQIALDKVADLYGTQVNANEPFQIEVKPPQGASLAIARKAPPAISTIMTLH
jgi:flagellin FlaB